MNVEDWLAEGLQLRAATRSKRRTDPGPDPGADPLTNGTRGVAACRFCGVPLATSFADLGDMPLANSFVRKEDLDRPEPRYPLHVKVCGGCLLVQHDTVVPPEDIFTDYAYLSSYSRDWCEHAGRHARMTRERFELGPASKVVEIGSNDGYLLKHYIGLGVPVLGVDPARNVAEVARAAGVPTENSFFGLATARGLLLKGHAADLIVANNVLAHVPDINDVIAGVKLLLKPEGVLTAEFPHLLKLMEEVQFDTIYHEHFFYYSLLVFERILARHGLRVFDVEELRTHGGSLRIFACHRGNAARGERPGLLRVRAAENGGHARPHRGLCRLRARGRGGQGGAARLPRDGAPDVQARDRLRRRRQGQHAAQLLRRERLAGRLRGR